MKNCFAGIAFLNGEMPVVKADNLLNPIPLPSDLVVKKGINIFSCNSGGIPGPLSAMSIDMCSSCCAWMLILPFSFPSSACMEFFRRLSRTWESWFSSPFI